jgi:hypothetical protein
MILSVFASYGLYYDLVDAVFLGDVQRDVQVCGYYRCECRPWF